MTAAVIEVPKLIDKWTRYSFPAAAQKFLKGAYIVGDPASQSVKNVVSGTATFILLGLANQTADLTVSGATLILEVDFIREKHFLWRANAGNITKAGNLFGPCYWLDNQTVTATAGTNTKAGTILDVDPVRGVMFEISGLAAA